MSQIDSFQLARMCLAVSSSLSSRGDGAGHVVLITSVHSETAATAAEMLAEEFARKSDADVVLVNDHVPDGRTPSTCAGGLVALMADGSFNPKTVFRNDGAALFRMPLGTPTPDAFFQSDPVAAALGALRSRFRFSFISGPVVTECGALIQQVDKVLLAVDGQTTSPRAAQRAMRRAGVGPTDIDGAILLNARSKVPAWLGGE